MDKYKGADTGKALMHWKYIKKVKRPNGKWRYYYDRKALKKDMLSKFGYDDKSAAIDAIREYNLAENNAYNYNNIQSDPTRSKWYSQDKADALYEDAAAKGRLASKMIQRYYDTPIGKIDKIDDKIDSARNHVADLITKVADLIRPKEELLDRYK